MEDKSQTLKFLQIVYNYQFQRDNAFLCLHRGRYGIVRLC
jgi:hypothetical protein